MTPQTSPTELALRTLQRGDKLFTSLDVWKPWWQELADYVMPRKAEIMSSTNSPSADRQAVLFETTAVRSNMVLANGQLSWMTPAESPWFSFDAPPFLKGNDEAEQWYRACSEVAQLELSKSNFYSEIHEFYLDRGAFGTAAIHAQEGKNSALTFSCFEVGSFAIGEDEEGHIDTFFRVLKMPIRNAAAMFGEDALSEKTRQKFRDKDSSRADEEIEIVHAIFPRPANEIDPSKGDPSHMPWASHYIERTEKKLLRNGGYKEQPAFASRYLKWGRQVYGWSPSWAALPEARQLNFLVKQLDALAEVSAFPRMLIPHTMEGDIDITAGGQTFFDPNAVAQGSMPREWMTGGRYDIGLDRENRKAKAIEEAFHVDLFQMFAQIDKQMTAFEAAQRASEKVIQFSPTFARMTTELFNPLLQRVWGLLIRGGHFPPPPRFFEEIGFAPEPQVSFSSRIALAIKSLANNAFFSHMAQMVPVWQMRPELMDNYDWDRVERELSRNSGVPARWLAEVDAVMQLRQARAEAQQRAQQIAEQQAGAETVSKLGSVKGDSVVAQSLSQRPALAA